MATSVKFSCMVVAICMALVAAPMAEAAISCGSVIGALTPCMPYLTGGPAPSPQCCAGVKNLNAAASTTPDRKTACGCLKNAAGSMPNLNAGNAAALPGKCGVNIPYKISTSTNCNTIKA
ncbi:non-specific lipid-transfer protein 4-like [Lotus japonicus]|uniref:Non-specific lipid-transfer protein n=1 Tax=Lotus japonicus TaxID=34305 RepID=I3T0X8_LOTJA|nr:non-specific lipid-transfer protein 4-like [Lotus japonicus]AFK46170.1 unknown [Lotus japonicus]